ncbi:MAG: glutathione S-transferase family protein [Alphaproteobacteria bacterium]|nr:glutathione S-transferase family protein [Alphaproteobacteria bacterium]
MSLKLHHLNASRSQRLVWLLEELQVLHDIVHHKRDTQTNLAPASLLDIHPMGKSPLLEDDGLVIAETGAIAEYLMAKYDPDHKLHPRPDDKDFPKYIEWIHAAEGAPFLPFLLSVYVGQAETAGAQLEARISEEQLKAVKFMEKHLSENAYFGGDNFTAADCLMGFGLLFISMRPDFADYPAIKAWLENVQARPAFQRMLEVGV